MELPVHELKTLLAKSQCSDHDPQTFGTGMQTEHGGKCGKSQELVPGQTRQLKHWQEKENMEKPWDLL